MAPDLVILQNIGTAETRAVRHACLLADGVGVAVRSIEGLDDLSQKLRNKTALPVGSVEFVRRAMEVAGIEEPAPMGYPRRLAPWFHRNIQMRRAGVLPGLTGPRFVKPVATKLFNGFVHDPDGDATSLSAHDLEQACVLTNIAAEEPVWVSEVVEFVSEVRYYVQGGHLIGQARYDADGEDNAPEPNMIQVQAAIACAGYTQPYTIDMGVLRSGQTALVELNQAWAIGLYGTALSSSAYLGFLREFWESL